MTVQGLRSLMGFSPDSVGRVGEVPCAENSADGSQIVDAFAGYSRHPRQKRFLL
jgi:hypothetical protein